MKPEPPVLAAPGRDGPGTTAAAPGSEAARDTIETVAARLALPDAARAALASGGHLAPPPELQQALADTMLALGWSGRADASPQPDANLLNQLGDILINWTGGGFLAAEHAYRAALTAVVPSAAAYRGLGECLARQGLLSAAAAAHDAWFAAWLETSGAAGLQRQQEDAVARGIPPVMLVTMPRSASEFIRDSLLRALDVPLIYASVGTIPSDRFIPSAVRRLGCGGALCRTHAGGIDDLSLLADAGVGRMVVHLRDPRQATVSWVHMVRRLSRSEAVYSAAMYNPPIPADFSGWSLEQQLAWALTNYLPGQLGWIEGWAALHDASPPVEIAMTTYEDFHRSPVDFLLRLLAFFGIGGVELEAAADLRTIRNYRSGRVDEWAELLSPEQRRAIWPRLAPLAERFGWTR